MRTRLAYAETCFNACLSGSGRSSVVKRCNPMTHILRLVRLVSWIRPSSCYSARGYTSSGVLLRSFFHVLTSHIRLKETYGLLYLSLLSEFCCFSPPIFSSSAFSLAFFCSISYAVSPPRLVCFWLYFLCNFTTSPRPHALLRFGEWSTSFFRVYPSLIPNLRVCQPATSITACLAQLDADELTEQTDFFC